MKFVSNSVEQTEQIAGKLAENLSLGDTVLLYGPLGSGKTTFVKGLCSKFLIEMVKSPSYVILKIYHGKNLTKNNKCVIYHIDLYRLEQMNQINGGEIAEYIFDENAIKIVEWADRLSEKMLPEKNIKVKLEIIDDKNRKITIINQTEEDI